MIAVAKAKKSKKTAAASVPPGETSTTTPAGIARHDRTAGGHRFGSVGQLDPQLVAEYQQAAQQIDLSNWTGGMLSTFGQQQIEVDWPCDKISPHPANRAADGELADSLAHEGGQWDAIVVRVCPRHWYALGKVPEGHVQCLSGHRRLAAARVLRWPTIRAIVRSDVDDTLALRILAERNARGKPLTDPDRAKLVKQLREAGESWEVAAKAVGLSAQGAMNLARIADAPEVWQRRLVSGETVEDERITITIHQATVREVAAYAHSPAILAELETSLKTTSNRWDAGRDAQLEEVRRTARQATRSLTPPQAKPKQKWEIEHCDYPLFRLDDSLRAKLQPLVVADKERATNVALWDELQAAAQAELLAGLADPERKSVKRKSEPTAVEVRQAREADDALLARKIAAWRDAWLRSLCADRIERDPGEVVDVVGRLSAWLMLAPLQEVVYQRLDLELDLGLSQAEDGYGRVSAEAAWGALSQFDEQSCWLAQSAMICRLLRSDPRNPDWPDFPRWLTDSLAAQLSLDVPAAWGRMQDRDAGELSAPLAEFLSLHKGWQLDRLGKEWGVYTESASTRAAKIALFDGARRQFPAPKAILLNVGKSKQRRKQRRKT